MDPNETWKNLLLALREGDASTAERHAYTLATWIRNQRTADWIFLPEGLQKAILALEVSE
jgi:hypothetical protein